MCFITSQSLDMNMKLPLSGSQHDFLCRLPVSVLPLPVSSSPGFYTFILNPAADNCRHSCSWRLLSEASIALCAASDKVLELLILIQGSTTPVSFPQALY